MRRQVAYWLQYLDSQSNKTSLTTTLEPSIRLLSSAIFSWNLSTTTLAWDANLLLAFPGVADTNNVIAPASVSLPSGYAAFVLANVPFTTIASTTSGSNTLTDVAYADQVQVGQSATGNGIPASTTVTSIGTDGTSIVLSNAATSSSAGESVTFAGSGSLTVQTAAMQSLPLSANLVLIARATDTRCYVGVGTGQMALHDGEARVLLEEGFSVRRFVAGQAISARTPVYVSAGAADGNRTAGAVYPVDASANFTTRYQPVGFAISQAAQGSTVQVATAGVLSGFSSLATGTTYYADPSVPGGLTTTKPTTALLYDVPLGIATSPSSLAINPSQATAARVIPQNITIPGTLTAASVVSGRGFGQQVDLGGIYIPANTNQYNSSAGKIVPVQLQKFYAVANSASGNAATRLWTSEAAGSVLALKFYASVPISNFLFTLFINYSQMGRPDLPANSYQLSTTATGISGTNYAIVTMSKGQVPFTAQNFIFGRIGIGSSLANDVVINVDMTIEMGA